MKPGELVRLTDRNFNYFDKDSPSAGIILETGVNMWGEEVIPSGISVMWSDGEIEILYEDEIVVIYEMV